MKPSSFPVTVMVVDGAGCILSCSPTGAELFGRSPKALEGEHLGDLVHVVDESCTRPYVFRPEESDFHGILMAGQGERNSVRVMVASHRLDDTPDRYSIIFTPSASAEPSRRLAAMRDAPLMDIIEGLPGIFYVIDQDARLVLWNKQLKQALALPDIELPGIHVERFFDADELPTVRKHIQEALLHGRSSHEATLIGADGRRTPYLFNCARTMLGTEPCVFGTGLDISERKEAELQLRVRERAIFSSTNAIVITCCKDGDHPIEYVNPAFERLTGYRLEEVKGRDSRFMGLADMDGEERARIRAALKRQESVVAVLRNRRKDGEIFLNELRIDPVANLDDSVSHFVGVINDVTADRQYQRRLRHAAQHDPLTGLANRSLLEDQSQHAVAMAREHGRELAFALLDLDNFKTINDTYGHEAGDQVLKEVANRLRQSLREEDTIARLGGDEFVLVISSPASIERVEDLMEEIRVSLGMPIWVGERDVVAGVSIGVAVYPADAQHADGLMRAADAAMYEAKRRGRNNWQFYSAPACYEAGALREDEA